MRRRKRISGDEERGGVRWRKRNGVDEIGIIWEV